MRAKFEIESLKEQVELLSNAVKLLVATKEINIPGEVEITRELFLEIYNEELSKENLDETNIYGKDVYVSWNGLKCSCQDGALACCHIIGGLENLVEDC